MKQIAFLDLDGVCFDSTERFARARKPDGKINFAIALDPALVVLDVLVDGVADAICSLIHQDYEIVLLTGRPEKMRAATVERLIEHDMQFHELIMRKDGDYRKSPLMKTEEVIRYLDAHPDVEEIVVIDDQVENNEVISQAVSERETVVKQYYYENIQFALWALER